MPHASGGMARQPLVARFGEVGRDAGEGRPRARAWFSGRIVEQGACWSAAALPPFFPANARHAGRLITRGGWCRRLCVGPRFGFAFRPVVGGQAAMGPQVRLGLPDPRAEGEPVSQGPRLLLRQREEDFPHPGVLCRHRAEGDQASLRATPGASRSGRPRSGRSLHPFPAPSKMSSRSSCGRPGEDCEDCEDLSQCGFTSYLPVGLPSKRTRQALGLPNVTQLLEQVERRPGSREPGTACCAATPGAGPAG